MSHKYNCCARGGDWFKNCGDAGDTKFDHTWVEGVQACEGYASLSLEGHATRHEEIISQPIKISTPQNTTKQKTRIQLSDSMSNAGGSKLIELAKFIAGAYALFVVSICEHSFICLA